VPDVGVDKVLNSVELTTSVRSIFTVFLAYRRAEGVSFSAWLPVELFFYSIVLDFFFYTYHRLCHEVNGLWQYHRTHHLTKHPNPLLSAYADTEQEIIEIALIPLLTYGTLKLMGFPMGFYDWWICHQYLLFSEAFGHSGLRLFSPTPGISSFFLKFVDMDLCVEDHDLHHRQGWKKSANYGKQTRVWDRIFGTCGDRIESKKENVDYVNQVHMPLY
jgi:sterol desaturase/sphingolipid hydroxylase (fatty acid hydroxylase superfamily)